MSQKNEWSPEVSGVWANDNATGRNMAEGLLDQMRSGDNPALLGHVVKSMIASGGYTGVEVGFFQRLSESLIARV